jgi:hypothetical protein
MLGNGNVNGHRTTASASLQYARRRLLTCTNWNPHKLLLLVPPPKAHDADAFVEICSHLPEVMQWSVYRAGTASQFRGSARSTSLSQQAFQALFPEAGIGEVYPVDAAPQCHVTVEAPPSAVDCFRLPQEAAGSTNLPHLNLIFWKERLKESCK